MSSGTLPVGLAVPCGRVPAPGLAGTPVGFAWAVAVLLADALVEAEGVGTTVGPAGSAETGAAGTEVVVVEVGAAVACDVAVGVWPAFVCAFLPT